MCVSRLIITDLRAESSSASEPDAREGEFSSVGREDVFLQPRPRTRLLAVDLAVLPKADVGRAAGRLRYLRDHVRRLRNETGGRGTIKKVVFSRNKKQRSNLREMNPKCFFVPAVKTRKFFSSPFVLFCFFLSFHPSLESQIAYELSLCGVGEI